MKDIHELPQAGSFALLVNDSIPLKIQEEFSMDYKVQFDINNLKEGNRGHKKRKTMKLYVLEKKE